MAWYATETGPSRSDPTRHGSAPVPDKAVSSMQRWSPEPLGQVSTEGGPLLLGDRTNLGQWTGVEGDDYERLAEAFDASEPPAIEIRDDGLDALAWSVPTGTTYVWRIGPTSVLLTRGWLDDPEGDPSPLALPPMNDPSPLGTFGITSGWLVVMWAAEAGSDLLKFEVSDALAVDLSVAHSAIVVAITPGIYECLADEVHVGTETALRCWIRRRADHK